MDSLSSKQGFSPLFIALLALCTSFASLVYELAIAQTLSFLTDEVIWWQSLTIGIFLGSTGLGVFLYEKIEKKNALDFFKKIEAILCFIGLLSLPLIYGVHILYRIYIIDYTFHPPFLKPLNWIMLSCQSPNMLLGILSGLELRSLFTLTTKSLKAQEITSLIIFMYHLGALLGSLVFGSALYFKMDTFYIVCFAAALNFLVYFSLNLQSFENSILLKSFCLITLFVSLLFTWSDFKNLHLKNFYYNTPAMTWENGKIEKTGPVGISKLWEWSQKLPKVLQIRTHYQNIDLVEDKNSEHWSLFLDGHYQFSTKREKNYHETLAHIPIMLSKHIPQKTLILGGGDGLVSRELLKYENLKSINLVELDKGILDLANTEPFLTLNKGALQDRRVEVHHADAFYWLKNTSESFDAIYVDFPYPFTFDGLRIYSKEFFFLISKRLRDDGFLAVDIPLFEAGNKEWESHAYSLFKLAGFESLLAFKGDYGESFLLAFPKKKTLSFDFKDHGILLEELQPNWLQKHQNYMLLSSEIEKEVNSVLKPRRISLPDIWK